MSNHSNHFLTKKQEKELKADAMDDLEIKNQDPDIKIIAYNDLENYNDIDELLPNNNSHAIILYQTESPTSGHWVAITRNFHNIYYFDSLGGDIDQPLEWNPDSVMKVNYLSRLLDKSAYNVFYNTEKYQKEQKDVNTCGRHAICWIEMNKHFNYDLDDYLEKMEELKELSGGKSYDEIVVSLINELK